MATTIHWEPKRWAASSTRCGFSTAAVLMATLSAPGSSIWRTSSALRTPPPTVNGMNTWSAIRRTMSTAVSRFSGDALMSRNTSSSAPSASYTPASSTGSPASRRSRKRMPLTTRPPATSKQGMIRVVSMARPIVSGARGGPLAEVPGCSRQHGAAGGEQQRQHDEPEYSLRCPRPQPAPGHSPHDQRRHARRHRQEDVLADLPGDRQADDRQQAGWDEQRQKRRPEPFDLALESEHVEDGGRAAHAGGGAEGAAHPAHNERERGDRTRQGHSRRQVDEQTGHDDYAGHHDLERGRVDAVEDEHTRRNARKAADQERRHPA